MKAYKYITQNIWPISWLACLFLFACSALMPTNGSTPGSAWQLDKIVHFLFFAFLTALPLISFKNRKLTFFCIGIIPIFGFTLEYMQKNISGRNFSPEDMIANNGGIVLGIIIGIIFRMRKRFLRQKGTQI